MQTKEEETTPEEQPDEPISGDIIQPPAKEEKKPGSQPAPPTKSKPVIWRRLFRGLMTVLILVGLGAVVTIMTVYLPARRERDQARAELAMLSQQSSSNMQAANQEIDRLSNYASDNENLKKQLAQTELLLVVTQLRLDVSAAQLALVNEDGAKARLALSKTATELTRLGSLLPEAQTKVVEDLQARLKLALEEIDDHPYAARSDLDVMANLLLELDNSLRRP
jgi:hypothetical protein